MNGAGPRTVALLERVADMEEALARGGDRIPEHTAKAVRGLVAGVRERLALGVDHTVVALVGGTGSGKSSVFNAICGLDFAAVGVKRPTTGQVSACVWAHDASALLDWLGVARDHRIERESALDGESQADLRGLVLLDLPDHDSVEPEHRVVVDRLLPLVDLLVWVVDPQKYADDALHTRYLRHLGGHEGAMLVLLNQIDAVQLAGQVTLLRDLDRLLREDGLVDVGVHGVSARTGEGVPLVRGVLARAVAGRGLAELRAFAEVDDAARALATAVAPREPGRAELPVAQAVDGLADAAGVPAVVTAAEHAMRADGSAPPRLGPIQVDRVGVVREQWLRDVCGGLPVPWQDALAAAVPGTAELARTADERLASVTVRRGVSGFSTVLRVLAAGVGVLGLAVAGYLAGTVLAHRAWTDRATFWAAFTGAAALLALILLAVAAMARAMAARRRGRAVGAAARSALEQTVEQVLVGPSLGVLTDHRVVREATAVGELADDAVRRAVAGVASTDPDAEVPSTA